MRIARLLADRLVAAVVPRGKAAAGYWWTYCYTRNGYCYYQWCTVVSPAGTEMCSCQPRYCCHTGC